VSSTLDFTPDPEAPADAVSRRVGIPPIAATIGGAISSALTFFWPKVWRLYEARYVDPKAALRELPAAQAGWYKDHASRLVTPAMSLKGAPPGRRPSLG